MDERRQYLRTPTTITVEIMHPAFGTIKGQTQDISDGGAHVRFENCVSPPVGTIVDVRFKKVVGEINKVPVQMRVMHSRKNTVGLMFMGKS